LALHGLARTCTESIAPYDLLSNPERMIAGLLFPPHFHAFTFEISYRLRLEILRNNEFSDDNIFFLDK
jgi:hypothetical protein